MVKAAHMVDMVDNNLVALHAALSHALVLKFVCKWTAYCLNFALKVMGYSNYDTRCIYIFGGSCPLTEFYVQVLRPRILAALLHGTPAAGISQTLWSGTRNGITELSPTAPSIFGRAAIMLGIGPHSSLVLVSSLWPPYGIGRTIIFLPCGFFLSFFLSLA